MKTLTLLTSALLLASVPATAQGIMLRSSKQAPAKTAPKATPAHQDVQALVRELENDKTWWNARKQLVAIGNKGERMRVLHALQGGWFRNDDPNVRGRNKLVADEINRAYTESLRKEELQERSAAVRAAADKLASASVKELPAALASLKAAMAKLDASIAAKMPAKARPSFGGAPATRSSGATRPAGKASGGMKLAPSGKAGVGMKLVPAGRAGVGMKLVPAPKAGATAKKGSAVMLTPQTKQAKRIVTQKIESPNVTTTSKAHTFRLVDGPDGKKILIGAPSNHPKADQKKKKKKKKHGKKRHKKAAGHGKTGAVRVLQHGSGGVMVLEQHSAAKHDGKKVFSLKLGDAPKAGTAKKPTTAKPAKRMMLQLRDR